MQMALSRSRSWATSWRHFDNRLGADGGRSEGRTCGGFSATCRDILANTQDSWMSSSVIDAALIELRAHVQSIRTYVLLVEQASSFHSYGRELVPDAVALTAAKEVATMAHDCERAAMVMNLGGDHWIAALVDTTIKRITVMGTLSTKMRGGDLAVQRIRMCADAMDDVAGVVREPSSIVYESAYEQTDDYNCGPFAVAHTVCAAMCLAVDPCVSGNIIRLAIIPSVLRLGESHLRAWEASAGRADGRSAPDR